MSIYGCHNKPRPTTDTKYIAQDGYYQRAGTLDPHIIRVPRLVIVTHKLTTECQYTKTTSDVKCEGCLYANV